MALCACPFILKKSIKLPLPFKAYPWIMKKKDFLDMKVTIDVQEMSAKPQFPTYVATGGSGRGRKMIEGVF
jgi:hypothetical protein